MFVKRKMTDIGRLGGIIKLSNKRDMSLRREKKNKGRSVGVLRRYSGKEYEFIISNEKVIDMERPRMRFIVDEERKIRERGIGVCYDGIKNVLDS